MAGLAPGARRDEKGQGSPGRDGRRAGAALERLEMAELAPDARRYEMGQGSHVRNGRPGGSAPTLPELTWGERAASHRTSSSDKRGRASPKHDPLGLKQRLKAATRSLPLAGYPILTKPAQLPSLTPCGGGAIRPRAPRRAGVCSSAPRERRRTLRQPRAPATRHAADRPPDRR